MLSKYIPSRGKVLHFHFDFDFCEEVEYVNGR